LSRINRLLNGAKEEELNAELAARLLKDETEGDGAAICRSAKSAKDNPANPLFHCHGFREQEGQGCCGASASSTEILVLESINRKV